MDKNERRFASSPGDVERCEVDRAALRLHMGKLLFIGTRECHLAPVQGAFVPAPNVGRAGGPLPPPPPGSAERQRAAAEVLRRGEPLAALGEEYVGAGEGVVWSPCCRRCQRAPPHSSHPLFPQVR